MTLVQAKAIAGRLVDLGHEARIEPTRDNTGVILSWRVVGTFQRTAVSVDALKIAADAEATACRVKEAVFE